MTSLKIDQDLNDLSQPFIIPNSSQEETKATDFDISNPQLPKVPSQSFLSDDPDSSASLKINSSHNPSTTNLLIKKTPSKLQNPPYLILHAPQETKGVALPSPHKAPPFVITQYLGPFIPPEGVQGINVDRLMPYLEFVTTIYEKSFTSLSFTIYQVWLCLYPVLTIGLVTTLFRYFKPTWDNKHPLQGLIVALVIICEMYSVYQAYKMFRIIRNKDKKGIARMIILMTVYMIVSILILGYFWFQDIPSDKDQAQNFSMVIFSHFCALIVHIVLTLIPAFWVRRAIVRFHRFIFLKNNLQDSEKTGIYYQYVFELLHMISEKGLLYPIKAPYRKNWKKKEIRQGIIQAFVEGFDATHRVPE